MHEGWKFSEKGKGIKREMTREKERERSLEEKGEIGNIVCKWMV